MDKAPFFSEVARGPETHAAYWVHASDGVRLRVAHWSSQGTSRGTIFVFQGRTENIEKYGPVALHFCAKGYDVLAVDWRGQGLSDRLADDRLLGHVRSYSEYQFDVKAVFSAAQTLDLPKPWFLLGHSLGGCIGLRAILNGLPVSACAFTAPLWDINLPPMQKIAVWPLCWMMQLFGRSTSYAPGTKGESYVLHNPFEDNRLTTDPRMYRFYQNVSENLPDQQIGGPSMGWLYQTLKETRFLSALPSPEVPSVAFCGENDTIVAVSAVKERMARWPSGQFELVPGARHDVLYATPTIREMIFHKILAHFERATR